MESMSNQAYLGVWCPSFPEDQILDRFGKFLATVPFSESQPGFTHVTIRAVDSTETPVFEQDLRSLPLDAPSIVTLAQDYLHADSVYEVRCEWDLWTLETGASKSQSKPQPLEIFCHGEEYDGEFWRDSGHFYVDLGFEHLFTGHARLLGFRTGEKAPPQSAEERDFLTAMSWPENLKLYKERTRENIKKLFDWVRQIETAVDAERVRLWSEGEENFEARLEEILAAR